MATEETLCVRGGVRIGSEREKEKREMREKEKRGMRGRTEDGKEKRMREAGSGKKKRRKQVGNFWSRWRKNNKILQRKESDTSVDSGEKKTKRKKVESLRKGGEKKQGAIEFGRRNSSKRMGEGRGSSRLSGGRR